VELYLLSPTSIHGVVLIKKREYLPIACSTIILDYGGIHDQMHLWVPVQCVRVCINSAKAQ
jgi:hypothetical protein